MASRTRTSLRKGWTKIQLLLSPQSRGWRRRALAAERERSELRRLVGWRTRELEEAVAEILGDYKPPDTSQGIDDAMQPVMRVADGLTIGKLNRAWAALLDFDEIRERSGEEARQGAMEEYLDNG